MLRWLGPSTAARRRHLLAAALVVLLGVSAPGIAQAMPLTATDGLLDNPAAAGLTPEVLATMRAQEALNPAAEVLTEAFLKFPESGYANLAFRGDGLALFWKGELPSYMVAALAKARSIGHVSVIPAAYSLTELKGAARQIDKGDLSRSNIAQIVYESDGSGLVVEKMPPQAIARATGRLGRPPAEAEQLIAAAAVSVPVRLTTATSAISLQSCAGGVCSRRDDVSPWNAGSFIRIKSPVGHPQRDEGCTSGFGVHMGNASLILTAAHCATRYAGGGDNAYDGAGEFIGRATTTEDWKRDVILLDGQGFPRMWDGTATTTTYKGVHSRGFWIDGELLCQSGQKSGTVCDLQTQSTLASYNTCSNGGTGDSDGDCYTIFDLGRTLQIGGLVASLRGDSGAPVFSLDGNGVRAKGIVSGGNEGNSMVYVTMNTMRAIHRRSCRSVGRRLWRWFR